MARWLKALTEFNFKLEHEAGTRHGNVDVLASIVFNVPTLKTRTKGLPERS